MAVPIRLAFVGDVMLGRGVSRRLRKGLAAEIWGDVLPLLHGADGTFANLECPITRQRFYRQYGIKTYHFRADPRAVDALHKANVRFVSLANNHMLDFGIRGLHDTLRALDGAKIAHAGAGETALDADRPVIFDVSGLKIGALSATDNLPEFAARTKRPGTNFMRFDLGGDGLTRVARAVRDARGQGAQLVVLSLHWGPNMRQRPIQRFKDFAHAAIDAGVDVLHGHSAHLVQGVEYYNGGLIMYDTGNMIDDYWKFPFLPDNWSFVFLLEVEDARPVRLRMVPVRQKPLPIGLARDATAVAIVERMIALSRELGTELVTESAADTVALRLDLPGRPLND
ncbi:MAG: CapA family protein [Alphaproteobacteria bacterium]